MRRGTWLLSLMSMAIACGGRSPASPPAESPPTPAQVALVDPEPWRNAIPKPGARGRLNYPTPASALLDNGLQVLVVRQPVQVIALAVVVRQGGAAVPEGKSGLAALTARMLAEGTERRSSNALAIAAEDLGSELVADAGRDYSIVSMTVLRNDLDPAVELLGEVLQVPAFDPAEFQRVRSQWVDRLVDERQSPDRLATLAGLRLLLGPRHGAPVGGSVPDVKGLTIEDIRTFYQQHYAPSEAALVAVGDVPSERVMAAAKQHFGNWKAATPVPPAKPQPPRAASRRRLLLVDRPDATQAALCVVQHLPPRGAPGHEAREVLNTALGGMFTSRLMQNLRENHGYTYGAGSVAVATRGWGAYLAMTTVDAATTQPAIREIVRELENAASTTSEHPLTDDEIERAKTALINEQVAQLENASDLALDTALLFVHDRPLDDSTTYAARIRAVTREAVLKQAQTHLVPNELSIVIVGPRAKIEPGLRTPAQTVETAHPSLLE